MVVSEHAIISVIKLHAIEAPYFDPYFDDGDGKCCLKIGVYIYRGG